MVKFSCFLCSDNIQALRVTIESVSVVYGVAVCTCVVEPPHEVTSVVIFAGHPVSEVKRGQIYDIHPPWLV